jgi:hypothetical protein
MCCQRWVTDEGLAFAREKSGRSASGDTRDETVDIVGLA